MPIKSESRHLAAPIAVPASVALMCMTIAAVSFVAAVAAGAPNEARFYVAPNGNDAWSGTLASPSPNDEDGPFATIVRARDAIRELRKGDAAPAGGIEVIVRGGRYLIEEPIAFTAEDSGVPGAPIVYSAVAGEEVRLDGGPAITNFEPVTDPAILGRLDESARGRVVQADLTALGLIEFGSPGGGGVELFFHDKPMTLARWPNEGFVRIAEEAGGEKFDVRGRKGDRIGKWLYEGGRPTRWVSEKEAWVHGYWFWDWSDQRHKVKSIDTGKSLIEVEKPYHRYGYRKGQWYYAFNLLAELDTPGEWYVDRETGTLYFWPPEPLDNGAAIVSVLPNLITMEDVSHLTLRNFTIEAVRETAITVSGGEHVYLIGCTFRDIGGGAVRISGGIGHGVIGCDIYDTGGGGVAINAGDRSTLTAGECFVENTHIHHYSRWSRMYHPAVSLNGVGNRASHNLIHDAPHMAIGFGGNDHVIEYNEIHSVCYESNDAGAIYAGRDWTTRGTVIRHNFMHHVTGFEGRGSVGVYLDDMFSGTRVYGNLFYRVTRAAFIGGGRDNIVEKNLFVDCTPALHIDNRAQGWANDMVGTTMKDRLDSVPYEEPPWSLRYPALIDLWEDEPAAPKGNKILDNVSLGGTWDGVQAAAMKYQTFRGNRVDDEARSPLLERIRENPQPKATDFAGLLTDATAAAGVLALPLERIGLFEDDARASWPVSHVVRR